jgi:hypothetical protein
LYVHMNNKTINKIIKYKKKKTSPRMVKLVVVSLTCVSFFRKGAALL